MSLLKTPTTNGLLQQPSYTKATTFTGIFLHHFIWLIHGDGLSYPDRCLAAIQVCVLSGWSGALLLHGRLLEGCRLWSSPPECRGRRNDLSKAKLFECVCTLVCFQIIYMMWCFLNLSDDSLAVTLQGTGHHHETSEMQVALQSITTHLPDLCDPKRLCSASFYTLSILMRQDYSDSLWQFWETSKNNLLVTKVSHLFVTQGQHSCTFPRHFLVDFIITRRTFWKLQSQLHQNTGT